MKVLKPNMPKNIQCAICCMFFVIYITHANAQTNSSKPYVEHIFNYVDYQNYDSAKASLERISIKDVERSYTIQRSPSSSSSINPPRSMGFLGLLFIPFIALESLVKSSQRGTTTYNETLLEHTLGQTPNSSAKFAFVEYLLKRGANPNKYYGDKTPIAIAVTKNEHDIIKLLYRHGANPTIGNKDYLALNIAAQQNDREILEFFIQNKIQFPANYSGTGTIASAMASGDIDMLDMLLTSNITFKSAQLMNDVSLLIKKNKIQISDSSYKVMVQKLIANTFDANTPDNFGGELPLNYAIQRGNTGLSLALISYTQNINHKNNDGETALMLAVRKGSPTVIGELVKYADLDMTNNEGQTAKDIAIHLNYLGIADLLESSSPEIRNRNGRLAALLFNDTLGNQIKNDSAISIIRSGITFDACRMRSYTSYSGPCYFLHYAVYNNNYRLAEELLKAGAAPNVKDGTGGKVALEYAVKNNDTGMARILINYGAEISSPLVIIPLQHLKMNNDIDKASIRYMLLQEFRESIHIEKSDSGWYYAGKSGNNVFGFTADSIVPFDDNNYSIIIKDKKWNMIDLRGRLSFNPYRDSICATENIINNKTEETTLVRSYHDGKWSSGYLFGRYEYNNSYDLISAFDFKDKKGNRYALVKNNHKYFFMSPSGSVVTDRYTSISQGKKGRIYGVYDGKNLQIAFKGQIPKEFLQ